MIIYFSIYFFSEFIGLNFVVCAQGIFRFIYIFLKWNRDGFENNLSNLQNKNINNTSILIKYNTPHDILFLIMFIQITLITFIPIFLVVNSNHHLIKQVNVEIF